nr:glutaminase [Halobacteriovorax marinus]
MQDILDRVEKNIQQYFGMGEVANYIPELAKIDPKQFAMTVATVDGRIYSCGSSDKLFSIQSISKVFVLTMAMNVLQDELWERVGKEPSGSAFNSLVQLETEQGIPRNPFINAGALVTTDAIIQRFTNAYDEILNFVRDLSQNESIEFDKNVALSEFQHSERNSALAYFMKSFGNIESDPIQLLDVYFHHCSIAMNTVDLAKAFLFLANGGVNPATGKRVVTSLKAKRVNSLMLTCGLYDNVGDFAYRVGLPAKSGVGGGIVAVLPGEFSVAVWSPELNLSGNSLIGTKALELFTNYTEKSIF